MRRKRLNILFTCVGRRVSLLESFRRAMGELDVSGRLVGADITIASPAFQKADRGVLVPRVDDPRYLGRLLRLVRQERVGLLVPLTDLDLPLLAEHQGRFAEMGCTVMIGSPRAVAICRDKARTSALVERAGLASIRTHTLRQFLRRPFYPCFVKPTHGSAGIGSAVIRDRGQLTAHAGQFGRDLVVQEYVPGREYTVDVYRSRAGQVHAIVPRQRLEVRSGEVEKAVTVKDRAVMQAARKLAEGLTGLWGAFCCQCRRPDGSAGQDPKFFEINPRFGGGAPLSIAAGADLPLYLLQDVLGLPITGQVGRFTNRLLMLRYDQAVFTKVADPARLPGYHCPLFR